MLDCDSELTVQAPGMLEAIGILMLEDKEEESVSPFYR